MALNVIRGTEPIAVQHPIFLIVGDPGIGKTSLGYSAPAPLLWDFDLGAHRAVNRRDTIQIERWSQAAEATADPREGYQTDVIDTVGRALDVITADIIANDPKKASGGALSQQGWGVLKTRYRTWMSQLRAQGRNVLLIAHAKEEKDGDTKIIRPDIAGGSLAEVLKVADFVGYLTMAGKDRVLDFSPTDRYLGKNPAGWPPFLVPAPDKAQSFMADLMARGRDALGAISAESAKVLQQVEEWKAALQGITEADALSKLVAEAQGHAPILAAQTKRALLDRAGELGFTFDRAAGVFVAPATTAA
jgi:hypothetical protein